VPPGKNEIIVGIKSELASVGIHMLELQNQLFRAGEGYEEEEGCPTLLHHRHYRWLSNSHFPTHPSIG